MKFERRPRKVMYVQGDDIYRATMDTVTASRRLPVDKRKRLVGVAAAVTFWERVDMHPVSNGEISVARCMACARTVKEAWLAGDRYMLDTDGARKAAEIVADLADTKPDDMDICEALIDLSNEIAKVRLANTRLEEFDILNECVDAIGKCYAVEGFADWTKKSQRRRFMFELPRKARTPVTQTLMGLYFAVGETPLLTLKQRKDMIGADRGEGPAGAERFFSYCIRKMTEFKLQ